jgi:hypothetical protein
MDVLPIEFSALVGRVNFIQQINENEWHSSCPNCGGTIHPDGTPPDRFIMWRVSRRGSPFGMCVRKCGWRWTPEKQDADWSESERLEFQHKQNELEAEWMKAETERLEKLSVLVATQMIWKRCHDEAPTSAQAYYQNVRGIPKEWQDELWLGYFPDYAVHGLTTYRSGAYTLPIFNFEGGIENITLRIENPMSGNDRYRRLYRSKAQHLHSPQRRKANKIILMEGELKADIATIYGWLPNDMTVYGAQSKAPERRILKSLDFAEVVYLAFDPDAYIPDPKSKRVAVLEIAKQIGMERTRFVIPPHIKFDDAILQGYQFKNAINMAVRQIT